MGRDDYGECVKCPSETTINQLVSGEDKCHFPGYKVRDSIRDFITVKQQYDNASWVQQQGSHLAFSLSRCSGKLAIPRNDLQMQLNASNPFYVDAVGRSYQRTMARLDKIMDQMQSAMNDIFFKDVFKEFVTDYVQSFYDELKQRYSELRREPSTSLAS
ncbi:hypothetical protein COOONC_02628 [Cooperia oncophora]